MQIARKLSIGYGEVTPTSIEQLGGKADTAFSLVMHRGFSPAQAARVLGISAQQVAMDFRIALKKIR